MVTAVILYQDTIVLVAGLGCLGPAVLLEALSYLQYQEMLVAVVVLGCNLEN